MQLLEPMYYRWPYEKNVSCCGTCFNYNTNLSQNIPFSSSNAVNIKTIVIATHISIVIVHPQMTCLNHSGKHLLLLEVSDSSAWCQDTSFSSIVLNSRMLNILKYMSLNGHLLSYWINDNILYCINKYSIQHTVYLYAIWSYVTCCKRENICFGWIFHKWIKTMSARNWLTSIWNLS